MAGIVCESRRPRSGMPRATSPPDLCAKGVAMIFRTGLLAAALMTTGAIAAEKETPSTVDIQKHYASIGNAIGQVGNVEQLVADFHQRTNAFPSSNAEA